MRKGFRGCPKRGLLVYLMNLNKINKSTRALLTVHVPLYACFFHELFIFTRAKLGLAYTHDCLNLPHVPRLFRMCIEQAFKWVCWFSAEWLTFCKKKVQNVLIGNYKNSIFMVRIWCTPLTNT